MKYSSFNVRSATFNLRLFRFLALLFVCIVTFCFAQQWSPAINLGIAGVDDIYPQTCRTQQQWSPALCMVWQAFQNGNWEIYSRFSSMGSVWGDTVRITNNPAMDTRPCITYDYYHDLFWCVWIRDGDIYASYSISNLWSSPEIVTSDPAIDDLPSICFVNDTVWVVWQRTVTDSTNIYSSFHAGTSWSLPIPVTNDSGLVNTTPKINLNHGCPFVVWEQQNDIYYSIYVGNSWQPRQSITFNVANDSVPDLTTNHMGGVAVCWQSDSTGNWEVYRTATDTFSIHHRVTNNSAADITPCPLFFDIPIRQFFEPMIVFCTDRIVSPDIYSWTEYQGLNPVDTNPAQDMYSVLTANLGVYVWVLWQTNRNAEWDIYGSYQFTPGGVEDVKSGTGEQVFSVYPNPFDVQTYIKLPRHIGIRGTEQTLNPKSHNSLKIYDSSGRCVKSFSLSSACCLMPTVITWSGQDDFGNTLPSGVYFLNFETRNYKTVKKLLLIR